MSLKFVHLQISAPIIQDFKSGVPLMTSRVATEATIRDAAASGRCLMVIVEC